MLLKNNWEPSADNNSFLPGAALKHSQAGAAASARDLAPPSVALIRKDKEEERGV